MMIQLRIIIFVLLVNSSLQAQKVDSAYIIYQQQFAELSVTRGVPPLEVMKILKEFNSNQLVSNAGFAKLLGQFYSKKQHIGVLLYFFYRDTLKRIFFEPGKIIEERSFLITKQELFDLGNGLNEALNLYKLSSNRAPVPRGGMVENEKETKKRYSLNEITHRLTSLLLPKQFNESYRHLIIIPSLNIGTIPFHLLKPYSDSTYLIDKCSFTIAPSLVDFVGLRLKALKRLANRNDVRDIEDFDNALEEGLLSNPKNIKFTLNNTLFVCNPKYPHSSEYFFPDLPGAEKEVGDAMAYSSKYILLKGASASKDSVLKHLNNADVAYFATHGVSSAVDPKDKSYLVLTGKDPFLTSKQIMDLRLDKNFKVPGIVILSACQTGLGKSMEAGVSGSLARSFILSGANHVIMSLWSVDDDATAYLMSRFVYHLQTPHNYNPAEPLRQAALDTKKRYPNPAHWASFSLVGIDY